MTRPERKHAPIHAAALRDARYAARQAIAALRAIDPLYVTAATYAATNRCAVSLRDIASELDRIARATERGQA